MEEKGLQKKKDNIFHKIRKYFYVRNMTRAKADKYEKLPDYLKLDEEVIQTVVNKKPSLINSVPTTIAINLIKTNWELLDEVYPSSKKMEIFLLFSDDEKIEHIDRVIKDKNMVKNVIMTLSREKKEQYFEDVVKIFYKDITFLQNYIMELSQKVKEEKFDFIVEKIATSDFVKEIIKEGISQETIERNFEKILNKFRYNYEEVKELLQYISKNTFDKYEFQVANILQQIKNKEQIDASEIEELKIFCKDYRELLGEDKIQILLMHPDKISEITSLSDRKLEIFAKCLTSHMQKNNTEEWMQIQHDILYNLREGSYDEFINNLEAINEANIEFISSILQKGGNIYNIRTPDDMERYSEIKRIYCDKWIKSEKIEERKLAVLEKVFGQDVSFADLILTTYGSEIEKLPDSDIRDFVQSLKLILNEENPDLLEQIYNECNEIEFVNQEFVHRKLKNEYWKMFKNNLFEVKNAEQIEDNVYDAGTDFRMIVRVEDKKEDYNNYIKNRERQYFSTSYIANDMISVFGEGMPDICFGYFELSEDSLMLSSYRNMQSNRFSRLYTNSHSTKFVTPETQIRKTEHHNEMCFRQIQKGEVKKPDYIVVYKMNGQIFNMDEARKAQSDLEGIPIVVIDMNACLQAEKEKVNGMIEEYQNNPSKELASKIAWAIKKNRKTYAKMCEWIVSIKGMKKFDARAVYDAIENNEEKAPTGFEEIYSELRKNNFFVDFNLFDINQYAYDKEVETDKEIENDEMSLSEYRKVRDRIKGIVDDGR